MVIRPLRFNTYLLVLAALALLVGCQTPESRLKKVATVLGVHLEVKPDFGNRSEPVSICRDSPMILNVEISPFLNETMITEAIVVESQGGFALQIQFDERGTRLLEQYSATNPGKHFAISGRFGAKLEKHRWLAAPLIPRRISNGVLVFTPDADREETEGIVLGLNNVAKKSQPKQEPKAK